MKRDAVFFAGLVMVAAIWGFNFGVSRMAMETFDPVLFTFLRFGIAAPILFVWLKIREGSVGVPFPVVFRLMLIGLFGITLLEILVMYSIKYTTLANASLLNVAPWPIFAALFAPLFTKETITFRLITGGFAAMAGVCLVILGGGEGFDLSSKNMIGNLFAFSVSIIGALFNLACMPLMRTYSALRVSAWFIAFGGLFMFPLTIGSWGKVDWGSLGLTHYSAIVYNVLFCTVISFLVWNVCMNRVGAARSNFFRYGVPASAIVAGYILFGETITILQFAGTVCTAGGLVWISTEPKQAGAAAQAIHSK